MHYDDDNMVYDLQLHRYVLTETGVRALLGIDLGSMFRPSEQINPTNAINGFLREVSRQTYNEIYLRKIRRDYWELLCAEYTPLRSTILELMLEMLVSIRADGDLNSKRLTMLGDKGKFLSKEEQRDHRTSVNFESLLNQQISGMGFSLSYRGSNLPYIDSQALLSMKQTGVY